MIKKLKKIFPSLIIYSNEHKHVNNDYKWFLTKDNTIIGIHHQEIDQKELSLLNAFLSPYNVEFPLLTKQEKKWQEIINEQNSDLSINLKGSYRFVYFSIQHNQIEPISFKDAILELFATQIPILWENDHEGIIIEERDKGQGSINYEQIIDVLMSDLYVKINFFVGPFHDHLKSVKQHYQSIIKGAKIAFSYSKRSVITYVEAVPYLLMNKTDLSFRSDIAKIVLQDFLNDHETLNMIETFVQCNLNISETAKELYLHRNSLQYRIDRFQEKTGIDIRQFHEAMTVYLALIANPS